MTPPACAYPHAVCERPARQHVVARHRVSGQEVRAHEVCTPHADVLLAQYGASFDLTITPLPASSAASPARVEVPS